MSNLFQSLTQDQKIDFFIQCQILLIKHHPTSSFVIREKGLDKALEAFRDNIHRYKGFYHRDENVCILWNHIFISDPKSPRKALTENAYKEPHLDYNAISIDWAVFRKMEDIFKFVKENYEERIEYVLFIREGNPKIYEAANILKAIGQASSK
jgi:flagellar biosynthesis regulator FlaF